MKNLNLIVRIMLVAGLFVLSSQNYAYAQEEDKDRFIQIGVSLGASFIVPLFIPYPNPELEINSTDLVEGGA